MFHLVLPIPEDWTAIASGDEFEFLGPVRTGMTLVSHERFEDAYEKLGTTGRLIFFTVVKSFSTDDGATLLRRNLHCVARPPQPEAPPSHAAPFVLEAPPVSQVPSISVGPVAIRHLAMFATATAEFVDIRMDRSGPDRWSMQLHLPTERLTADVTGSGQRIPRKAPQPGFMSVVLSGAGADRFQVFTYFGHHHQESSGIWRAEGTGLFASALAIPGEQTALGTYMQDGWQARFGVYSFE